MAFSGLRPESIGNYDGSDGLRLGYFVEAETTYEGLKADKMPTILVIRKELNKARHQYFTFVSEQTLTYINEHLVERIENEEELALGWH